MNTDQDAYSVNDLGSRSARHYIHFLNTAQSNVDRVNLPALDPIEEQIFRIVILKGCAGERLSVRDLIHFDTLGSPTMLHGRITSMRRKGWLQLDDTEDTRRKRVALTETAKRHLDWPGSCILDAAQ